MHVTGTRHFNLLAFVVLSAGCGSGREDAKAMPELPTARSTVFGAQEGGGALSSVFGVAVSDDGRVFLSEPQFARVVEFTDQGTFAREVGTRGDGPGEFRVPGALFWRADSLAVTDFQRGINLFSPDGIFQTLISFFILDDASPFGVRPIFPLADGSIAAMAPAPISAEASGMVTHETWLKASRDGVITDTLAVLALDGRSYSVRYQSRGRSGAHPLSWAPVFAAPPTGRSMVIIDRRPATSADAATFRVFRIDLHGDTVATTSLSYVPRPLTSSDVDSIASAMAEGWSKSMNLPAPALAAAIKDQIVWPEYRPPVTLAVAGADGSVWLRREAPEAEQVRWDILDEALEPIGWVVLPEGLDVKVVSTAWVYGVELDEFDVPWVVRFEVGEGH